MLLRLCYVKYIGKNVEALALLVIVVVILSLL